MAKPTNELTPMQRQYQQIKERNQDCILFFRLGDFYEMFNEDAKLAARELDLTLTSRDRSKPKEEQTPMCGVPYHSVDSYIARLVQKGYKVAICEQMEDPALAKGLVERDITRIVTPGTVTESCMLDESKNNYMGCLYGEGGRFGLAFCDVSTGAFFVTLCADAQSVASELGRFSPSEVMRFGTDVSSEAIEDALFRRLSCCVDEGKDGQFSLEDCEALLEKHFSQSLAQMGLAGMPAAVVAAGALLQTLLTLQKNDLAHIRQLQYYTTGRFMELDLDARRNLELTETMRSKEKKGTLLWVLDKTHTAMGGRLLRSWLEKPLLDPVEITRRHAAVEDLVDNVILRGELEESLREVTDLERVMARVVTGTVNCRDLLGLARGLRALPEVKRQLEGCSAPLLTKLAQSIDPLTDCADEIENTIVDEPPLTVREGGIIRKGADAGFDGKPGIVVKLIQPGFRGQGRPGAHDGHIAFEHVEELGKLVQAGAADEVADAGFSGAVRENFVADDPGVKVQLEHFAVAQLVVLHELRFPGFGVQVHAAEFVHLEGSAVFAHPGLGEENGAGGGLIDGRCHEQEDNPREQAADETPGNVHDPLGKQSHGGGIVDGGGQTGEGADLLHKFLAAQAAGDLGQVQMDGDAHLLQGVQNLPGIIREIRGNHQHLVHPGAADVGNDLLAPGHHGNSADFRKAGAIVPDGHAVKCHPGEVIVLHGLYRLLGGLGIGENQKTSVTDALADVPAKSCPPDFPAAVGKKKIEGQKIGHIQPGIPLAGFAEKQEHHCQGGENQGMLQGDLEIPPVAPLEYVVHGAHGQDQQKVYQRQVQAHVPIKGLGVRVEEMLPQEKCQEEGYLEGKQIQQNKIQMLDPAV